MKSTSHKGALKGSAKDNTYKHNNPSPKYEAAKAGKGGHEAFKKGQLRKNAGPGKKGPYAGNPGVIPADYASREHSAFGTQHQSDVNKGGNYRKGKPQASLYMGSNLAKNYKTGKPHDSYYKGNKLSVDGNTSSSGGYPDAPPMSPSIY